MDILSEVAKRNLQFQSTMRGKEYMGSVQAFMLPPEHQKAKLVSISTRKGESGQGSYNWFCSSVKH